MIPDYLFTHTHTHAYIYNLKNYLHEKLYFKIFSHPAIFLGYLKNKIIFLNVESFWTNC